MNNEQLFLNIGVIVVQTAIQVAATALVVVAVFKMTLRRMSVNVQFRSLREVKDEHEEKKAA